MADCNMNVRIVAKRQQMKSLLGEEDFSLYLKCYKKFFSRRINREELDTEIREFIKKEAVLCHNELSALIFNKVINHMPSYSSKDFVTLSQRLDSEKSGVDSTDENPRHMQQQFDLRFRPVPITSYIPKALSKEPKDIIPSSCVTDGMLPDIPSLHGLMIALAWEMDLDSVADDAVNLMMFAIYNQMKTILMTLFSRRSAYKMREKRFKYCMGCPAPDIYLRNSKKLHQYSNHSYTTDCGTIVPGIRPTLEWAESETALEMACDSRPCKNFRPASSWDLFNALALHRSVIPSHAVYATIMEKISASLDHPSLEEIEQERIKKEEDQLKAQIEEGYET